MQTKTLQTKTLQSFKQLTQQLAEGLDVPTFADEQEVDDSVTAAYTTATKVAEPEKFTLKVRSVASAILPSVGQVIGIRTWISGKSVIRPLFVLVPTRSQLMTAASTGRPVIKSYEFEVITRWAHPMQPSVLVPRLKSNQEHVLLTVYKSPYGVRFQVHTMDGTSEPLTPTVSLVSAVAFHRKILTEFIGQDFNDRELDVKEALYRALPLGTFTQISQLAVAEISHNATQVPPALKQTMAGLLLQACALGGHNPFKGTRDTAYADDGKGLTVADFIPSFDNGKVREAPVSNVVDDAVGTCDENNDIGLVGEHFAHVEEAAEEEDDESPSITGIEDSGSASRFYDDVVEEHEAALVVP